MNIRHLKYITTIAEERSISEAARKLFVEQSSLSHCLKKNEEEIGMPLFLRTTPLVPTYAGEVYLETAADKPLRIAAREKICGLPAFEDFVPRPAHMAPEPNRTLVRLPLGSDHTYSFCTVDLGLPPAKNQ